MKRMPVLLSFILFIALCASAAYWGLQLIRPPLRPMAAPPPVAVAEVRMDSAAGLFGGRPVAAAVASNYQLKGVVVLLIVLAVLMPIIEINQLVR